MSMLDSFFNKGFRGAKCKTLLKLTIPRIKLLRNRREIQIKQMRREMAKLLETSQEATARIRVEHIIREENMMAAHEILELFCELISVRLPIIETQRECPLDLKEAISSLCFAAPRCADLPELLQVQLSFAGKYGREFVAAATELMPDCGVNRQLIELLSIRAPSAEKKLKILKQIAEEHNIDWDPAASETELFKSHEDLLNGPTQFVSGTEVPLPPEKHDDISQSVHCIDHEEKNDSDADLDLDFPEVPKVSVRAHENVTTAPSIVTPPPTAPPPEIDSNLLNRLRDISKLSEEPKSQPEEAAGERPTPDKDEVPEEEKQFVPFISAPSLSSVSFSVRQSNAVVAAQPSPPPQITRSRSEGRVDLQDVLAAAQAAAETAERAAAAARSAASLAQLRINELSRKNSDQVSKNSSENPFHNGSTNQTVTVEKPCFDRHDSIDDSDSISSPPEPQQFKPDFDDALPDPVSGPTVLHLPHLPQRLPSMDEEPYFSYPNLFRSQGSNLGSPVFDSNPRSPDER